MNHLYFVRHGLSVLNQQGLYAGSTDTPLTTEGREQARQAGEHAKSLHIDTIVSSPLQRAADTAGIIAATIGYPKSEIIYNNLFVEREMGELEGTPYDPHRADFVGVEGAETNAQLVERLRRGFAFLQRLKAENILVVAHGATGRALLCILNPDIPFYELRKFPNGEITKLL